MAGLSAWEMVAKLGQTELGSGCIRPWRWHAAKDGAAATTGLGEGARGARPTRSPGDSGAAVQEHKAEHPDGYQYSQFAELYRRFEKKHSLVLRQPHAPGGRWFRLLRRHLADRRVHRGN
jgi:hypothetical protein